MLILVIGFAIKSYTPEPTISEKQKLAIEFIQSVEGLKLYSYLCPGGRWSIGYGTKSFGWVLPYGPNGKTEVPGERINKAQAYKRMVKYLNANVWQQVPVGLPINEYAVYSSLVYNLPYGKPKKLLKNGRLDCNRILLYDRVSDKVNEGIKIRRQKEYELCKKH